MTQRLNAAALTPDLYKTYYAFSAALKKGVIGEALTDLIHIRVSQINGCAFCVDMHVKEATIHGERALRLHHLAIWRESPLFDARERAALAWTESVTRLGEQGVPDAVYEEARMQFSEKELDMQFLDGHLQRVSNQFGNEYGDFVTAEAMGVGPHMTPLPGKAPILATSTGQDPNEGMKQASAQ